MYREFTDNNGRIWKEDLYGHFTDCQYKYNTPLCTCSMRKKMYGYCKSCYKRHDECECIEHWNGNMYTVSKITKEDNINKPKHYNHNHKGIECIDAIEAALTPEEFIGYLKGTQIKYIWRLNYKDTPLENAEKSGWYSNKLIQLLKNAIKKT